MRTRQASLPFVFMVKRQGMISSNERRNKKHCLFFIVFFSSLNWNEDDSVTRFSGARFNMNKGYKLLWETEYHYYGEVREHKL